MFRNVPLYFLCHSINIYFHDTWVSILWSISLKVAFQSCFVNGLSKNRCCCVSVYNLYNTHLEGCWILLLSRFSAVSNLPWTIIQQKVLIFLETIPIPDVFPESGAGGKKKVHDLSFVSCLYWIIITNGPQPLHSGVDLPTGAQPLRYERRTGIKGERWIVGERYLAFSSWVILSNPIVYDMQWIYSGRFK